MRFSEYFIPTLKESPADAEVISHKLMVRAGMIRKLAAGIYIYLPFGLKFIRNIENIVREEMNNAGAIELLMPSIIPAELWQQTERWQHYGKELLRIKDRHNRDFCYGPTHEEVITDLVAKEIKSYKQLPVNFYQIQTKFRDEIRPRFGLMRGREFIMKDAYSFDIDEEGAELSYKKMYDAYCKIFERCGLEYRVVEADTGAIGGSFSHEFMVLANTGEDTIVTCSSCGYSANLEKAPVTKRDYPENKKGEQQLPIEKVYTPQIKSIEDVSKFLKVPVTKIVKTIILTNGEDVVAAMVRGDFEINIVKVKNVLGWDVVYFATEETVKEVTGAPSGFAGPIGIKCKIIADYSVKDMENFIVGANEKDYHLKNVNFKDFDKIEFYDIRNAVEGDKCPKCSNGEYEIYKGIEVGHIFKLGTKYSEKLNATYLDKDGKEKLIIMGCYGIGIGRTAAAAIEQNHDEDGMILPEPISPFKVYLLAVNYKDDKIKEISDKIYKNLKNRNIEVLLDDRDERAGKKFKDADLLGFPYRINVGKKAKDGIVELVYRKTKEIKEISVDEIDKWIT